MFIVGPLKVREKLILFLQSWISVDEAGFELRDRLPGWIVVNLRQVGIRNEFRASQGDTV